MNDTVERIYHNFDRSFEAFKEAGNLMRPDKAQKLISQIDLLSRTPEGLAFLYEKCLELEAAGIFEDTAWSNAEKQAPPLVRGTLLSGHPNSSLEILSELRMMAYARGRKGQSPVTAEDANAFLEEVLVHNLEFAFDELAEESRSLLTDIERKKVVNHFRFLFEHTNLSGIKSKLAIEIRMVCAQRPVATDAVRKLIKTVHEKLELDPDRTADRELAYFMNAVYRPSPLAIAYPDPVDYETQLAKAPDEELKRDAEEMGKYLDETGLTNPYLAVMLRYAIAERPELVQTVLKLKPKGIPEWERYKNFAGKLALSCFGVRNSRGIYGFKRMLERNLFARRAVRAGLTNLKLINMNPDVEKRVRKSVPEPDADVTAKQYLLGALIAILGQPLGIGQGNNATCQSARGISLWAQHAPAKLINMITTAVTSNNLIMRFENHDLEAIKLGKGLVDKLDYRLDALSVVLVPLLDKIYNEMMRRASGRGEDPHKWVNPALYGQWISPGFASAYSYLSATIQDFSGFVRLLYAAFHPRFNGGRQMVYPNPVGIFITSSKGDMLGFHAVSLLRIAENNSGSGSEIRAYFLNPNNEGRQDWGQGITPTVYGCGEKHGESSLPLHQFSARVYAFHYNQLNVREHLEEVQDEEVEKVVKLARESWGRAYQWSNFKKSW